MPDGHEDVGAEETDALLDEITRLIQRGRKIEAIKVLREHGGMSLRDAKEEIEEITERLREAGELEGVASSRSGCGAASLAVIAGVTAAAWFGAQRLF